MSKSYKIIIKGKVQGVWFRKYTKQKAEALGVSGYVINQPNGDVLLEVNGSEMATTQLIDWLHQGSPLSRVREVHVLKSDREFSEFEIRY